MPPLLLALTSLLAMMVVDGERLCDRISLLLLLFSFIILFRFFPFVYNSLSSLSKHSFASLSPPPPSQTR